MSFAATFFSWWGRIASVCLSCHRCDLNVNAKPMPERRPEVFTTSTGPSDEVFKAQDIGSRIFSVSQKTFFVLGLIDYCRFKISLTFWSVPQKIVIGTWIISTFKWQVNPNRLLVLYCASCVWECVEAFVLDFIGRNLSLDTWHILWSNIEAQQLCNRPSWVKGSCCIQIVCIK